ncbi:indole-3-glycerol-phosphate synthase TrpC, partial [Candidatus Poribacteria bacterium]
MTILERILEHKRREVEERRRAVPIGKLEEAIRSVGPPRDF